MRPVMRTIALFLLLVGAGTGQSAAQSNPQPQDNPQGGPPPRIILRRRAIRRRTLLRPRPDPAPRASISPRMKSSTRATGSSAPSRAAWPRLVEKAGSQWGLPNGYVLGQEAGGAVVAGLRYGEGILYTKNAGDLRVFWQGPSLGSISAAKAPGP